MMSYTIGQEIEIYEFGSTTDISGTTLYYPWVDFNSIQKDIRFKNITNTDKDLSFKRVKIEEKDTEEDYICWGRIFPLTDHECFTNSAIGPYASWSAPHTYHFPSMEIGMILLSFRPYSDTATAHYRYYIEENGTALDSLDIIVYNSFLSIDKQDAYQFQIYPNPTSNLLNIKTENLDDNLNVTISDLTGKKILTQQIINGKTQLNIEHLSKGVYIYTIRKDRSILKTEKLVVN